MERRNIGAQERDLEDRLHELASLGMVSWKLHEDTPLPPFEPILSRGKIASDALLEDREDRF